MPHTVTKVLGPGKVTSLEVSAIRREDPLRHRPQVQFPASTEPKGFPTASPSSPTSTSSNGLGEPGTSPTAVFGETCAAFIYHVPAASMKGVEAPGHHHHSEQISVVVRRQADARLRDRFQRVGPGTIMLVPPNVDHYGLAPVNDEDLVLLEFQPIVREGVRRALATSGTEN